jgi:hypothetical protein
MDEYLSFAEAKARLHTSRSSVYRLVRDGMLTPYYRAARRNSPMFLVSQVESLAVPRTREDLDRVTASA